MELIAIVLAVLTGAVYARGARFTRRPMPWWRSTLFFSGLVALVLALASGIEILAGDLFGISMALIDGQVKIGRSRNTPPAARAAEVVKGHGPSGGGH